MPHLDKTRRQLLSLMLGVGTSVLPYSSWGLKLKKRKVVVIGAGFAGIGAAQHLIKAGYDVEIVEAQERIGGRVHSLKYGRSVLELGAAWLDKGIKNPLHSLARQKGMSIKTTDFSDVWVSTNTQEGHFGHPLKIDNQALKGIDRSLIMPYLKWQAAALVRGSAPHINMTILNDYLHKIDPSLSCVIKGLYEVSNGAELNQLHVLNELGAAGNDQYGTVSNKHSGIHDQDYLFIEGMAHFVEILAGHIPLSLNEAVKAIDWGHEKVLIETNRREIEADAVIVTSSIGLLKSNNIRFNPEMPRSMKLALNGLSMGNVNKIILTFPEAEWGLKQPSIHFCDPKSVVNFAINGKAARGEMYFTGIAGANKAQQLEQQSNESLAYQFKQALEKALGFQLPEPTDVFVTRWKKDPWALGAYSMINMNASGYEKLALRESMNGKVFLAGEGLSIRQAATVNGAYYDGIRAAEAFIHS